MGICLAKMDVKINVNVKKVNPPQAVAQEVAGHSPYGINNAKFYAEKYAWTAVYNADNYAYFAEACR